MARPRRGKARTAPPILTRTEAPRLVVFDLDGTLVDSGAYIGKTMALAFTEEHLELPSAEAVRAIIGLSLETALARLSGRSGTTLDRLAASYRRLYHQNVAEVGTEPLYAGVREVLDALSGEKATLLAVATGKSLRGVERILRLHQLEGRFVSLQTPDANPSKPDPSMLFKAMAEAGIAPDRTLMVGDTAYDMEMAVAAGCFALGVTWGYHRPEDLRRAGAEALVERVADLVPAINTLLTADA